jgi:hypothetical protein
MQKLVKEIVQIEHHRNGVSGEPFHAVLFKDTQDELFVATVFDTRNTVAVLRVAPLSTEQGVRFGYNSWRGDHFEPELRAAIAAHDKLKYGT